MIHTLENILVPGGRARISPYVEDAQLEILFKEIPSPANRRKDIQRILCKNEKIIEEFASIYHEFNLDFKPELYARSKFLRLYLAYYFTTNVLKIQICLIDLVRKNKLAGHLEIVDIGVGAGTTAVAVLDFLFALSVVCQLHECTFPIKSVMFRCYDRSQTCLSYAKSVTEAFCQSVSRRRQERCGSLKRVNAIDEIISWGSSVEWVEADISGKMIEHSGKSPVLLFASNILNELTQDGKENLARSILSLPPGSIAIVIEPGKQALCKNLNKWKAELLNNGRHIIPLSPCGDFIEHDKLLICGACWNSRRESLHEPLLYKKIREVIKCTRSCDEESNRLLSWSYAILLRTQGTQQNRPLQKGDCLYTRILGTFLQKAENKEWQIAETNPDAKSTGLAEYIKLCPGSFSQEGVGSLWARREEGFILPPLEHGSTVSIHSYSLTSPDTGTKRTISLTPDTIVKHCLCAADSINRFLPSYTNNSQAAVDEIAYRLFGFAEMKPFQHQILASVLTGKSILGIAATGGGKSECFILPAMLFPGATIVISPLNSLMQDQYEKRIDERYGLRNLSTIINGDISFSDRQARLKRMELGYYKLVYFTPEQIQMSSVLNALKRTNERIGIRFLALDEAHCISQWGHDFRDSYLNLVSLLADFDIKPVRIALTATASPEVRVDLCEELGLRNAPLSEGGDVFVHSSNRPELNFIVKTVRSTQEKIQDIEMRLVNFKRKNDNSDSSDAAIIFMPWTGGDPDSRRWHQPEDNRSCNEFLSPNVNDFAVYLERTLKTRVSIYHGGMENRKPEGEAFDNNNDSREYGELRCRSRHSEQNDFINGKRSIMIATKGFGMGIDKPDIHLVIHRTPTANLEAYAQEAGRAGRNGEISDVLLYYSTDSSSCSSDYSNQESFLSDKYIRQSDVVAMRFFLLTVEREVSGYLYFTSDEILPFFNRQETQGLYTWPEFPHRTQMQNESAEHSCILDRGYLYNKKSNYIGRILSALYRIRPDSASRKRMCMVNSLQETGARLYGSDRRNSVLNAKAIIRSNTYFGELFREKGLTEDDVARWLTLCRTDDTLSFARFLGVSPSGLNSLLWDINRSDGFFEKVLGKNRWRSNLLDFWYIVAPRYGAAREIVSIADWLKYAGARSRASKEDAYDRACRAQRSSRSEYTKEKAVAKPTVEDWFAREITEPQGWEILPGLALKDDVLFGEYLAAFMALHDRRKANDRASYRLLLTDYVGVEENGRIPLQKREKACLRAVMLGYLKTGEVVVGDNCGSCSRCVPNGDFEQDKEKREHVVERLGTELQDLLLQFEEKTTELPDKEIMLSFWHHVEASEKQGRSLRGYIEGWTGRVLTDSPEHKTVTWLRVYGMVKGYLPLHQQEACERALICLENVADNDELNMIWDIVSQYEHIMPPDFPYALILRARACHRLSRFEEAKTLWYRLLDLELSGDMRYQAHAALFLLTKPDGPFPEETQARKHAIHAARDVEEIDIMTIYYDAAAIQWKWEDFREEVLFHSETVNGKAISGKLLLWWLNSKSCFSALLNSPPPENWQHIMELLKHIVDNEANRKPSLHQPLIETIKKWSDSLLRDKSASFISNRLHLALIAWGITGNTMQFCNESLIYLQSCEKEEALWLQQLIDNNTFPKNHPSINVVRAECLFKQGIVPEAITLWHEHLITLPKRPEGPHTRHVLDRLIELHRPGGELPDKEYFSESVAALARMENSYDDSLSHYVKVLGQWDWNRLMVEIKWIKEYRVIPDSFALLALWIDEHFKSLDNKLILDYLSLSPDDIITADINSLRLIFRKLDPMAIAMLPMLAEPYLRRIYTSYANWNESTQGSSRNRLQPLKSTTSSEQNQAHELEFLCCAELIDIFNRETFRKYKIGKMLFNSNEKDWLTICTKYTTTFMERISSGTHCRLFMCYKPQSLRVFERWLSLFSSALLISSAARERIKNVAEGLLGLFLKTDRNSVEKFVGLCVKYDIVDIIDDFSIVKNTAEIITWAEQKTSIHQQVQLNGHHLHELTSAFTHKKDELSRDVLIVLLKLITLKTRESWRSPLSRLVEELIKAGRIQEAQDIAVKKDLTVGRERVHVNTLISRFKGTTRQKPRYEDLIVSITIAYMKNWQFKRIRK